jgi:ubiquinone/menaquinone biosynthesis C-methylase UbiE/uncharacterized protein YbaR (Trm112 family)
MNKFKYLSKIKSIYEEGGNIIQYLKSIEKNELNSVDDILISYDFQSGSYIKGAVQHKEYNNLYTKALAKIIDSLGSFKSIIEIGVGEGTTLKSLLENLNSIPSQVFGIDISWSRLKFAKYYLSKFGLDHVKLCTSNLFELPFLDNSIDIVYTSHSLEPNGGNEEAALKELFRVTKKYLILLEPAFELADENARERMKKNGYVTNLVSTAKNLNYNVIEHRLFDFTFNPLNPTGLIIIEKMENSPEEIVKLVCPISHKPLSNFQDSFLYAKESFLGYPVLDGIPCLLKDNSILATHLLTDCGEFLNGTPL